MKKVMAVVELELGMVLLELVALLVMLPLMAVLAAQINRVMVELVQLPAVVALEAAEVVAPMEMQT